MTDLDAIANLISNPVVKEADFEDVLKDDTQNNNNDSDDVIDFKNDENDVLGNDNILDKEDVVDKDNVLSNDSVKDESTVDNSESLKDFDGSNDDSFATVDNSSDDASPDEILASAHKNLEYQDPISHNYILERNNIAGLKVFEPSIYISPPVFSKIEIVNKSE